MNSNNKKEIYTRINRISGQIEGIKKMLEEERYCIDILTQISAVRSALDKTGIELLTSHLKTCIIGHGTSSAHKKSSCMSEAELITEVEEVLARFLK